MPRRLFYAIEFPPDVRSQVAAAGRELCRAAKQGRWIHPDNLHLTLQFLGDCPEEWLPDLWTVLRQTAAAFPPFTIRIKGCGVFGRRRDILWLGVEVSPQLRQLAGSLCSMLRQKQLPLEDRDFTAHITLGRQVRIDPAYLQKWTWPAIELPVRYISLMESTRIEGRLTYLAMRQELLFDHHPQVLR